ncbi:MAG: mannose-1-phosphate guanylyltransferase [Bacteroidetes bacterium]|nr:MAG: mannose-1-phosphate guanylyltransferase [Bacteroidota bacterium]
MSSVYAVIMAGGVGTRFWPRSREKTPKQLLEIIGKGTMIQNTVARLRDVIEPRNIIIVTNKLQKPLLVKQLPEIPVQNILIEPIGRNTAPCIGLAALYIRRFDPEAVMVVLPADHIIQNEEEFRTVLRSAISAAYETKSLITIGIHPTRPETGYGYIQVVDESDSINRHFDRLVYRVKTFAEKPTVGIAKQFLESGDYLWNSGMFIWRVDTIMQEIERLLPEMYIELKKIDDSFGSDKFEQVFDTAYRTIRGISIDYGVMEKAKNVFLIKGNFGWSDVGSWDEVLRLSSKDDKGNSSAGKVFFYNSNDNFVQAGNKFVATVGVDDIIVIVTDDSVLVCKKGQSQDVKEVVDYLRRKQLDDYL